MLEIILSLELYIQMINVYQNFFWNAIMYSFNFILIFYYKLDSDSKNLIFNFLTFKLFKSKDDTKNRFINNNDIK